MGLSWVVNEDTMKMRKERELGPRLYQHDDDDEEPPERKTSIGRVDANSRPPDCLNAVARLSVGEKATGTPQTLD